MKRPIFLLPLVLLLLPSAVLACSCVFQSPTEVLQMSDVVFVGVVFDYETVEPTDKPAYKRVELQASKYWKGDLEPNRTIFTAIHSAGCGVDFDRGKEYLVYARHNAYFDGLYTMLCWRTQPAASADADLDELGEPDLVPVTPATWGRIKALYPGER